MSSALTAVSYCAITITDKNNGDSEENVLREGYLKTRVALCNRLDDIFGIPSTDPFHSDTDDR